MGNLKIGGQNVGKIFLGDKQIWGGLHTNFYKNHGAPIGNSLVTFIVFINNADSVWHLESDTNSYDIEPYSVRSIVCAIAYKLNSDVPYSKTLWRRREPTADNPNTYMLEQWKDKIGIVCSVSLCSGVCLRTV